MENFVQISWRQWRMCNLDTGDQNDKKKERNCIFFPRKKSALWAAWSAFHCIKRLCVPLVVAKHFSVTVGKAMWRRLLAHTLHKLSLMLEE